MALKQLECVCQNQPKVASASAALEPLKDSHQLGCRIFFKVTKKQKGTSSKTHWQSKTTDNKKKRIKKKKKTLVTLTAANPYKFISYDEWAGPDLGNVSHRCLGAELMTD